ncbi:Glycoside hydrolase family 17-like protein [Phytophthora cinnamomi]|uniref:Glycoside hydrolase family 17-like protein n=1 Tax=Phytophthora cinnamomi TaxID=4785 RepID=UPI003559E636|nr:Glycoside hydrolase family 17-like protein [Phytophthora cinnamomi]
MVDACDVLGVNIHPYFTPGTTADNAIDVLDNQWKVMEANFADKLLLTETGWPSDGELSGNTGSSKGQEAFFGDYKSWSKSKSEAFYFQAFDTPYKTNTYERSYGLLTSDSVPKFGIAAASNSAGTVTAQNQNQNQS